MFMSGQSGFAGHINSWLAIARQEKIAKFLGVNGWKFLGVNVNGSWWQEIKCCILSPCPIH